MTQPILKYIDSCQTGSKSVITLNLNRIIQDYSKKCDIDKIGLKDFPDYLKKILERVYKYHTAYNELLWDMYDAGLLPAYQAGFIDLNKQYLTIGINGLNQAAEFLGIQCNDNEGYKAFCQLIFSTIKEQNALHKVDKGHKLTFNTECVPRRSGDVKPLLIDLEVLFIGRQGASKNIYKFCAA